MMNNFFKSLLFLIFAFSQVEIYGEVQKISYRGYTDCYQLSNDSVKLIVVAQAGARIFNYSLNDKNAIFEDVALNGKTIVDYNKNTFEPDGGRFDFRGSASISKKRDTLWIGPYRTEITSRYSMKMTSMLDKDIGIEICREFFLDSISSHLRIRQTMTNRSKIETNYYFWGRIFCPIDGKIVIPLNPNSKFNSKWGYYNGSVFVSTNASDTLVEALDTLLTFRAVKTGVKMRYAADVNRGWIMYGQNEQLLLMKYDVDLSKTYLTDSGESLIFYTDGTARVELEPVSPATKLSTGQSYTFEEDWWLFSYPKAKTKDFDGTEAASFALRKANSMNNQNTDLKKIDNSLENNGISIVPNPAKSFIKIQGLGKFSVQLCTMSGSIIYNENYTDDNSNKIMNIQSISNGIYFLKIFKDNNSAYAIQKLVVNN